MFIEDVIVQSNRKIADNTYLIKVETEQIAFHAQPGQFCNIRVTDNLYPLLRRPFSVSDIEDNSLFFMYKVVGEGTTIMANKKAGDKLNLLGPLGNSFNYDNSFYHVIMIGGGIGIAPFPYLIKKISSSKNYSVLFGVRTKSESHTYGLKNICYSSDDGSIGIKGNVIDLLDDYLKKNSSSSVKIFACGPNPMLKALQKYSLKNNIECEVSMESAMACGFGICQGCPIEHRNQVYKLICKDGPIFNLREITI